MDLVRPFADFGRVTCMLRECGCQMGGFAMPKEVFRSEDEMFRCEAAAIAFQETWGNKSQKGPGTTRLAAACFHFLQQTTFQPS